MLPPPNDPIPPDPIPPPNGLPEEPPKLGPDGNPPPAPPYGYVGFHPVVTDTQQVITTKFSAFEDPNVEETTQFWPNMKNYRDDRTVFRRRNDVVLLAGVTIHTTESLMIAPSSKEFPH
ncbi:hypothetical protein TELCIR_05052 [Teladorsagia circumcincta]|uniref:Uncharacterized protein n=1 Tax=Teladorsagia circumcincta TaxID=45464 RepID=A0A2G9US60_TELCI|nr:hypothetical protein TELCIR_05052 [Teladorsagia circumcincta]